MNSPEAAQVGNHDEKLKTAFYMAATALDSIVQRVPDGPLLPPHPLSQYGYTQDRRRHSFEDFCLEHWRQPLFDEKLARDELRAQAARDAQTARDARTAYGAQPAAATSGTATGVAVHYTQGQYGQQYTSPTVLTWANTQYQTPVVSERLDPIAAFYTPQRG